MRRPKPQDADIDDDLGVDRDILEVNLFTCSRVRNESAEMLLATKASELMLPGACPFSTCGIGAGDPRSCGAGARQGFGQS